MCNCQYCGLMFLTAIELLLYCISFKRTPNLGKPDSSRSRGGSGAGRGRARLGGQRRGGRVQDRGVELLSSPEAI